MHNRNYYIINGITLYRLITAPVLALLIIFHKGDIFRWMLAISFFTDAIDGYLARKFRVVSLFGSKTDSIADGLTIIAAIAGVAVFKPEFIQKESVLLIILMSLFVIQTLAAFIRYGRISSFHTYSAKTAAVLQGVFLILLFFLPDPVYPLFYVMAFMTITELIEEIILVFLLPEWKANVKGLWWVRRGKAKSEKVE